MASYATTADLAKVVPAGVLTMSSTLQEEALETASAEADTYIRNQYTLPLGTPYDPVLVRKVCQLAAWQLLNWKGRKVEAGKLDIFEQMQANAMAWLVRLSAGKVSLASSADASPGVRRGAPRVHSKAPRGYERLR